jgi:tetratricopeptide (TPR) repeat protein
MSLASLLNGVRKGSVGSSPRRTVIVAAVVLGVGAVSLAPGLRQPRAAAEDITHHTIPQKWIDPLLAEDLPDLKYPAYFEDFDKAKAQANAGRYKTALITLRKITNPKPEQLVTLALARGKALAALGRPDEALKALSADDKVKLKDKEIPLADHPQVQVLKIQVLADVGRTDEALSATKDHLKAYPDSWGGHYLLGEVSEQVGDTDTAKTAYAWFIEQPQDFWGKWTGGVKLPEFENAENVTWLGRAADRWATLNLKYEGNNALPRQILNTFVKASLVDADFWPAHVAAAEYFLGHDDAGQALAELKAAIDFNPQDARTLALLGRVFVSKFDFDKADSCIEALRKVDPKSVQADVLDARNLILQHRPKDAEETVRRGLARQPKNT